MSTALCLVSSMTASGPGSGGRDTPKFGDRPKSGNGSDRKPTILVVEDEILIRLSAADYLRKNGYRVLEASNAHEARTIFYSAEPIEMVFSDINMPGEANGFELARWINHEYPGVQVLLTWGAGDRVKPGETAWKDAAFIAKPYRHELLLVHVKRMLKH